MNPRELRRTVLLLGAFAAVFVALTVSSYTQESATIDEPQHLTAGYAALRYRDFRMEPEHPPLLRMWVALPLLAMRDVHFDITSTNWLNADPWASSHEFLYEKNDADRLLYRARFMTVLLGVLLGVVLFLWARQLYGFWPAAVVLALYTMEPNILAHAGLATTDLGCAFLMFVALYFLWRTAQDLALKNLSLFTACFALAQVAKFSALALWPMALVLLAIRALGTHPWRYAIGRWRGELDSRMRRAIAASCIAAALFLVSVGAVWAVYGFRYEPAFDGSPRHRLRTEAEPLAHVPHLAGAANWIDKHHLLPNACVQGFLLGQGLERQRWAYLLGQIRDVGWWYYFPVAFLIKTPVSLLLLFIGGLVLIARQRRWHSQDAVFILVPPALYMAIAMAANLNIGLRHILPVYPFVLLIAGNAVSALLASRRKMRHAALGALCLFQAAELGFVYPHYLAFFNQLIGGPRNGYKYLADSNLDWGQDLKPLKKWMDQHNVRFINLSYFGLADPAYYGIDCDYLPLSPYFTRGRAECNCPGWSPSVSKICWESTQIHPVRSFTGSC